MKAHRIENFLLTWPWVDIVVALFPILFWRCLPAVLSEAFVAGVSTLAGLALAAVTFVSTVLLEKTGTLYEGIRDSYRELPRNIIMMMVYSFVASMVPLFSFIIDAWRIDVLLPFISLALVTCEVARVLWWLHFIMIADRVAASYEDKPITTEDLLRGSTKH